jgi:hypothetical protein
MTAHRTRGVAAEESHKKREFYCLSFIYLVWVEGKDVSLGQLYRVRTHVVDVHSQVGTV